MVCMKLHVLPAAYLTYIFISTQYFSAPLRISTAMSNKVRFIKSDVLIYVNTNEAETHLGNLIHLRQLFARRIGENGRKKVTPLFAAEQLNLRKEIVAQDERIYFLFRHVIFDVVSDDIRRRG